MKLGPHDTTVLVTGASVGLGLAISRLLIERGYQVVLTARPASMARFAEAGIAPGPRVHLEPLDVTDPGQREDLIGRIEAELGGLDVLVNNAGVSLRAVVEHVTEQDRIEQMDVNFRSPMELARLALPGMRSRRRGKIITVSSVGGMMAMPTMAAYSASKFALEGASEALWYEVRPWGISVSLVQPGFINSDGFTKVQYTPLGLKSQHDPSDPYHAHYRHMANFIARMMARAISTPGSVAHKVLRVIEQRDPPLRVPGTPDARLFDLIRRLLPRRLYHWVLYRNLPRIAEWGPGED